MIRKLAITVFAMSLTLVGCGSSSTSKKDAAPDGATGADVAGNKDVLTPMDTRVVDTAVLGDTSVADTAVDTSVMAEVGPKLDMASDTVKVTDARDGGAADRTPDTFIKLDSSTVDTKVVDAPMVDTAVPSDASSEVGGDAETD